MNERGLVGGLVVVALAVLTCGATGFDLATWNVEGNGEADPDTVAQIMSTIDVDLWGLCGVRAEGWVETFEAVLDQIPGRDYEAVLGNTGGPNLRILALYDTNVFEFVEAREVSWVYRSWYSPELAPREPLYVHLRHKETGYEFLFLVCQLYRGDGVDPRRLDQAQGLAETVMRWGLPTIAVGDFNFDWDLDANQTADNYNKGFGHMTSLSVFSWVVPQRLVKTHDSFCNCILDFVFVANAAGKLTITSDIIVREGDFPDTSATADHRPVRAEVVWYTPYLQPHQVESYPCDCAGADLNCSDFATHEDAQACSEHCKGLGYGDVFCLDGDEDGNACESLP